MTLTAFSYWITHDRHVTRDSTVRDWVNTAWFRIPHTILKLNSYWISDSGFLMLFWSFLTFSFQFQIPDTILELIPTISLIPDSYFRPYGIETERLHILDATFHAIHPPLSHSHPAFQIPHTNLTLQTERIQIPLEWQSLHTVKYM